MPNYPVLYFQPDLCQDNFHMEADGAVNDSLVRILKGSIHKKNNNNFTFIV